MKTSHDPLSGPPPTEVPLSAAPLVRVIAQVRFPIIASIVKGEFIAPFQEAIRKQYPVLQLEEGRQVVFSPQGVQDTRTTTAWRFSAPSSGWQVTLAPEFLTLETTAYTSRDDFMARLRSLLVALETHLNPGLLDRLGVRYINRITGPNLDDLTALVRPEVSGVLATSLAPQVRHSVSEQLLQIPGSKALVMVRWGKIPAQTTVDPAAIAPIETPSWLLDIDMFETFPERRNLDIDAIVTEAESFTERIYSVFRWAVTDELLSRYGGQS